MSRSRIICVMKFRCRSSAQQRPSTNPISLRHSTSLGWRSGQRPTRHRRGDVVGQFDFLDDTGHVGLAESQRLTVFETASARGLELDIYLCLGQHRLHDFDLDFHRWPIANPVGCGAFGVLLDGCKRRPKWQRFPCTDDMATFARLIT